MTSPSKVKIVLRGALTSESLFRQLTKWPFLKNLLGSPQQVITSDVSHQLKKIAAIAIEPDSISLAGVVARFVDDSRKITPADAEILGEILNKKSLDREKFLAKEKEALQRELYRLHFQAEDDSFYPAGELLVEGAHSQANPDESKRAGFAPPKYLLSDRYQGKALDFFFLCREKIALPVDRMSEWVRRANSLKRKISALRYLLDGEHGEKLSELLLQRGLSGTWLDRLDRDAEYFHDWSVVEVNRILFKRLKTADELFRNWSEYDGDLARDSESDGYTDNETGNWFADRNFDPYLLLSRIFDWWSIHKNSLLPEYIKNIYPAFWEPRLQENEIGAIDRSTWLTLFVVGHFQTIGRQRDFHHRGFILLCQNKGWWEVFARQNPQEHADDWMRVLEEFIGSQLDRSEYEHWMNHFPAIYRLSRWLDDYYESFLSINRSNDINLEGILRPRANHNFQGGGVDAPPIAQTLGIGACFIIRELRRMKILTNPAVIRYCYLPTRRVRELFRSMGCNCDDNVGINNSRIIYDFLCEHLEQDKVSFLDSYDIPLQILTLSKHENNLRNLAGI